jgi:hypothetical protein
VADLEAVLGEIYAFGLGPDTLTVSRDVDAPPASEASVVPVAPARRAEARPLPSSIPLSGDAP